MGKKTKEKMRINPKQLKFTRVEDGPEMCCNFCEKEGKGFLMCEIELFTELEMKTLGTKAHFSLVVCSKSCERFLKAHPETPNYIRDRCKEMKAQHLLNIQDPAFMEKLATDKTNFEDMVGEALGKMGLKLGKPIGRDE